MDSIQALAQAINDGVTTGQVIGQGKKNYTLWSFRVDGYKIYYKFIKMLSSSLEVVRETYPDIHVFPELESDWHTQARLTHNINETRKQLLNANSETAGVMPLGKYKGQKISEMTDTNYLSWLGSQTTFEGDPESIELWIWELARKRCEELGLIVIGERVVDITSDSPFAKNTSIVYNAIQEHKPIQYVATGNDGSLWCAYNINTPRRTVGHPFYGQCTCLLIDGQPKKAKGMTITIYDYDVEGININVKGFCVNKL